MKLLNLCGKLLFVTESSNDDDENVSLLISYCLFLVVYKKKYRGAIRENYFVAISNVINYIFMPRSFSHWNIFNLLLSSYVRHTVKKVSSGRLGCDDDVLWVD